MANGGGEGDVMVADGGVGGAEDRSAKMSIGGINGPPPGVKYGPPVVGGGTAKGRGGSIGGNIGGGGGGGGGCDDAITLLRLAKADNSSSNESLSEPPNLNRLRLQ